jgi:uncharacterized membrane protein YoaK (UPF0700 family)
MPHPEHNFVNTSKAAVALLLTFLAGYVDVVGYVALFHVFTANMTGNTVHLARHLVDKDRGYVMHAAAVLVAFVGGSIAGRTIIEIGARNGVRRVATATLLMEAVLISSVAALAPGRIAGVHGIGLLIMLASGMGLQTATLTRVGPLTVHTTFVTGMLNKLAQLVSHALFLGFDHLRGRPVRTDLRQALRRATFFLCIWALYFLGAVIGICVALRLGLRSLAIPAAMLAAAIAVDQLFPLALEEERDQV